MQQLPVELHIRILGLLVDDVHTVLQLSEVNHYWCSLARDVVLWRSILNPYNVPTADIPIEDYDPEGDGAVDDDYGEVGGANKEDKGCPLRQFPAAPLMMKYRSRIRALTRMRGRRNNCQIPWTVDDY